MQLLIKISPTLEEISNDGVVGQDKISQYTRYLTLFISILQAIGMVKLIIIKDFEIHLLYYIIPILTLVTGSIILMWIGEQITEKGIGNGMSLIIFIGIISNLPTSIFSMFEKTRQGEIYGISLFMLVLIYIFIILFIIIIEKSRRNIMINYPSGYKKNSVYINNNNYLPLKINMAGVIPPIFASSLILLPTTIISWLFAKNIFLSKMLTYFAPGKFVYTLIFGFSIVFFCFFYTKLIFNSKEISKNLRKSGGFILGIRPGLQTSLYIDKIITKLTIIGSLYILLITLFPEFLILFFNISLHLNGISTLIVIIVLIDFITQIQILFISDKYKNLMKSSKL